MKRERAGDSTDGWRGLACCEWSALPPGAMVIRSQPEIPLRTMSESIATQQQGLVSMSMPHVTIREHEDSLVGAANGNYVDVLAHPIAHWISLNVAL